MEFIVCLGLSLKKRIHTFVFLYTCEKENNFSPSDIKE